MKRCVFFILCVILGPGVATAQMSLDEAFAVLKKRGLSEAELVAASEVVLAECADGDEACIRRLMDVWSDRWPAAHRQVMMLACQKADDATVGIILDAVAGMINASKETNEPPGGRLSHRASEFFFEPARLLCERLSDPELVARFAVENDRLIGTYPLPAEIMEKYTLLRLRRQRADVAVNTGGSVAGLVSKGATEELRAIFQELYEENPRSGGAWSALNTLVDFGDKAMIPDLERILADAQSQGKPGYWTEQKLRLLLVRLRYRDAENEREVYLKGAREEREFGRLLSYYVKGLIRLRVPKTAILEALETNQKPNSYGLDITWPYIVMIDPKRVAERPRPDGLPPIIKRYDVTVDEAILTPEEIREYHRELAESRATSRALTEERDELWRKVRLSPKFDEKAFRADPDAWRPEFPAEVKRLAEIEEARKALSEESATKRWSVRAVIDRAP
ncbi:MAG TPA: hypothetical protein VM243_02960 [Phycisphaerae bacterium]|nr:hypothetical protein [Phycisphaerae bacterium]